MKQFFAFALLAVMAFAVMQVAAISDSGLAEATATSMPTVEATISPSPAATPFPEPSLLGLPPSLPREDARERQASPRPSLVPRTGQQGQRALENVQQRLENRQQVLTAMQQRVEQMRQEVTQIRSQIASGLERIKELKGKAQKNKNEEDELKQKVVGFYSQSFDERIRVAQALKEKGADATLVDAFVAFAQSQKTVFAAATTNAEKRTIVAAFNLKWVQFHKAVTLQFVIVKVKEATVKSQTSLEALKTSIATLSSQGKDVSALQAMVTAVQARIDSITPSATLGQARWRLNYANQGLRFLHAAVQRVLNGKAAGTLPTETEPQNNDDVLLTPSATASATPSPSAVPTATASPSAEVTTTPSPTAAVSVEASVTPTPSPTATPTAAPTA